MTMLTCTVAIHAQVGFYPGYKTSLGMKYFPGSISLKHHAPVGYTIEVIGYFWKGNRLTGLYQKSQPIKGMEGLYWFFGGGAHISMYEARYYGGKSLLGADGIIGLDYKVPKAPINLSFDWQPSADLGGGAGFVANWAGISLRYVLQ